MPPEGGISNKNPLAQMEEEKKENDAKIEKLRQEMETVFAMKVKEKVWLQWSTRCFSSSGCDNLLDRPSFLSSL